MYTVHYHLYPLKRYFPGIINNEMDISTSQANHGDMVFLLWCFIVNRHTYIELGIAELGNKELYESYNLFYSSSLI